MELMNEISSKYLYKKKPKNHKYPFVTCTKIIDLLPQGQDLPELRGLSDFLKNKIDSLEGMYDLMEYAILDPEICEEVEPIVF
jgi:hypothetical protein